MPIEVYGSSESFWYRVEYYPRSWKFHFSDDNSDNSIILTFPIILISPSVPIFSDYRNLHWNYHLKYRNHHNGNYQK